MKYIRYFTIRTITNSILFIGEVQLDKNNKTPLYVQLMDDLVKKIDKKVYYEHEKLPSERDLCEIYNLSRITIRQALRDLEREGYIYKVHGKGTFVASKPFNQKLVRLYSFTEEMKKNGKTPKTKVLAFSEIEIEEPLAKMMNLETLEEVFQIIRLRIADNEPLMYETSYLPKKFFPNLTKDKLIKRPMYDIFKEDYQIVVTRAIEHFTASLIRKKESEHLHIEINQPAILIKRFSYYNEDLIEYTINVVRADKFGYTVELQ